VGDPSIDVCDVEIEIDEQGTMRRWSSGVGLPEV
jgi:hypothetical protein